MAAEVEGTLYGSVERSSRSRVAVVRLSPVEFEERTVDQTNKEQSTISQSM
jgi:hypothetical protein